MVVVWRVTTGHVNASRANANSDLRFNLLLKIRMNLVVFKKKKITMSTLMSVK